MVDDDPTDDSCQAIEQGSAYLNAARPIVATARWGANDTRRIGAEAAAGELVPFCDAGDVVGDVWVATMADPAAVLACATATATSRALSMSMQLQRIDEMAPARSES